MGKFKVTWYDVGEKVHYNNKIGEMVEGTFVFDTEGTLVQSYIVEFSDGSVETVHHNELELINKGDK